MPHNSLRAPITRTMVGIIVGLMVVGTALFVTGAIIEHTGKGAVSPVSASQEQPSSTSQDPDGGEKTPTGHRETQGPGETVFGLDLENPWVVATFVLLWASLIPLLIRFGRTMLPALLLLALAATVLDVGEVLRQFSGANTLLTILATLVSISHVVLALLALMILLQGLPSRTVQQA